MADLLRAFSTRRTPQSRAARNDQGVNYAGGYTFTVAPQQQLHRFLTLGVAGGTYYVDEKSAVEDNAQAVLDALTADHAAAVAAIVDVSTRGAAPRQQPALFALALAASHGTDSERSNALDQLPKVARTGTALFQFVGYVEQHRGWGRALKRAVADWYLSKTPEQAAFQAVKYRQRGGWSHRDVLRLAHPTGASPEHAALFEWITRGTVTDVCPIVVSAFEEAQRAPLAAIRHHRRRVTWEMLPTDALNDPDVWKQLIKDDAVPLGALIRQLPRLTRLGVAGAAVRRRIADPGALAVARIHPMNVLVALRTYAAGQSERGKSTWQPDPRVTDALDAAFYASFSNVVPAGKRTLIGLDVSGSMGWNMAGSLPLTAREAGAALALVTVATEPDTSVYGFTSAGASPFDRGAEFKRLDITPRRRLDDVVQSVSRLPFGSTDCALPMLYAANRRLEVDTFIVITDNETWAGPVHPHQALEEYRQQSGIPARLVVAAMTPTRFTVADPTDPGSLDVSGFDTATPATIAGFSRGDF